MRDHNISIWIAPIEKENGTPNSVFQFYDSLLIQIANNLAYKYQRSNILVFNDNSVKINVPDLRYLFVNLTLVDNRMVVKYYDEDSNMIVDELIHCPNQILVDKIEDLLMEIFEKTLPSNN